MWCRQMRVVWGAISIPVFLTPGCWRLQFSVRSYKKGGDASVASHLSPWANEKPEEAAFSAGTEARTPAKRPHEPSSSSRSHGDHSRDHRRHSSEKADHRSRREDHRSSDRREDHRGSGRREDRRSSQHEAHDRCLPLMHASSCARQLSCPVICWGGSPSERGRRCKVAQQDMVCGLKRV